VSLITTINGYYTGEILIIKLKNKNTTHFNNPIGKTKKNKKTSKIDTPKILAPLHFFLIAMLVY
jgi:hypothetical protein